MDATKEKRLTVFARVPKPVAVGIGIALRAEGLDDALSLLSFANHTPGSEDEPFKYWKLG